MVATVSCPFCGEPTEVEVDDEVQRQTFIQDCDVCCHPIQIRASVDEEGEVAVDADRA